MVAPLLPLRLTNVSVMRKGKTLIGPVDHQIAAGGLTVVLGPNGSGKTTLLRAMHGLERLSEGSVRYNIPEIDARPKQSFVFQSPIMLRRTVRQNLTYGLTAMRRHRSQSQVELWLSRIGLTRAHDTPAPQLSGGEKQKLALARALITGPELLFLDEPCANLDGRSTREIEGILLEAHKSGTRIVMATHDLGQAKRLATEALFMLGGRIHEHGPAATFFDGPQTREAAAFLNGDIVE